MSNSLSQFVRGPGPLVSVLLPSRGRPDMLKRAVASLYDLAADKGNLELFIKADDDDAATVGAGDELTQAYPHVSVAIGPRGAGFFDLHQWLNTLAVMARGDWLFIFTDDAIMRTPRWDAALLGVGTPDPWPAINEVCLVIPMVKTNPGGCDFPILRRDTCRLLGGLSPIPYADSWIHQLMGLVGAILRVPIEVEHDKPPATPLMGEDRRPQTICNTRPDTGLGWQMVRDAAKLLARIDLAALRERWDPRPPAAPGWYWWRGHSEHSPRFLAVHPGGGVSVPGGERIDGLTNVHGMGGEWCPQL